MLANVYLHWFDKRFYAASGPASWAKARLVRYADDLVVMARYQGPRLVAAVESLLEAWMGLTINRDKTRVVKLKEGAGLDFLGYTLRYERDRYGRGHRYLRLSPSKKALKRERAKLKLMTDYHQCFKPIPRLIGELNRHLRGWANYFGHGYPRHAFRDINSYVNCRLAVHLGRRSQRPFRLPKGTTLYRHLQTLGLVAL